MKEIQEMKLEVKRIEEGTIVRFNVQPSFSHFNPFAFFVITSKIELTSKTTTLAALSSEKAKLENQLRVKIRDCTILNSKIDALNLEGKEKERKGEEKVKETERIIEGLRDSIRLKESDLQEKSKDTERIISGLKSDFRLKEKDLEEKSRDLERVVEGLREEGREGGRRIEELKEKVRKVC